MHKFPAVAEQSHAPLYCTLILQISVLSAVYLVQHFPLFFFFFLVTSLFKMASKHIVEVLTGVPKKNALEKIYLLDELCSDMSYSAVSHEFSVNECMQYLYTETYTKQG